MKKSIFINLFLLVIGILFPFSFLLSQRESQTLAKNVAIVKNGVIIGKVDIKRSLEGIIYTLYSPSNTLLGDYYYATEKTVLSPQLSHFKQEEERALIAQTAEITKQIEIQKPHEKSLDSLQEGWMIFNKEGKLIGILSSRSGTVRLPRPNGIDSIATYTYSINIFNDNIVTYDIYTVEGIYVATLYFPTPREEVIIKDGKYYKLSKKEQEKVAETIKSLEQNPYFYKDPNFQKILLPKAFIPHQPTSSLSWWESIKQKSLAWKEKIQEYFAAAKKEHTHQQAQLSPLSQKIKKFFKAFKA